MRVLLGTVLALATFIALLVAADWASHSMVTARLTANDSPIYDRADPNHIDWDGPDIQGCEFAYYWRIFPYQTCYARRYSGRIDGDAFFLELTGPPRFFRPLVTFTLSSGRTPDSPRFSNRSLRTHTYYTFYPNLDFRDWRLSEFEN